MSRLTFSPPTVLQKRDTGEFLTTLFSEGERGVTVMITGGVATEKQYVSETELKAADFFFLGGHFYSDLSAAEAAALTDAGYTVVEED